MKSILQEVKDAMNSLGNILNVSGHTLEVLTHRPEYGLGSFPPHFVGAPPDFQMMAEEDASEFSQAMMEPDVLKRILNVRARTSLTTQVLHKLRLEEEPLDEHRWSHYGLVLKSAPILAGCLSGYVADVEQKYNEYFPASSDVSIFCPSSASSGYLVLADFTSSQNLSPALASLRESAAGAFNGLPITVVCVIIRVDHSGMGPFTGKAPEFRSQHAFTDVDLVTRDLASLIQAATAEEALEFTKCLEDCVLPAIDEHVSAIELASNESASLIQEVKDVAQAMERSGTLSKGAIMEAVQAAGSSSFTILKTFLAKAEEMGKARASSLVGQIGKGIDITYYEDFLPTPIPLQINEKSLVLKLMSRMYAHDPFFKVMDIVLNDIEPQDAVKGVMVMVDYSVRPIPYGHPVNFDRPQNLGTPFPARCLALARRLIKTTVSITYKATGEKLTGAAALSAIAVIRNEGTFDPSKHEVVTEKAYSPGAQVLFNEQVVDDPRFRTFLSRNSATIPAPERPDTVKKGGLETIEFLQEASENYAKFVESCIPSAERIAAINRVITSTASKSSFLLMAKAGPNFQNAIEKHRLTSTSHLSAYFESRYSLGRAIVAALKGYNEANYLCLQYMEGCVGSVLVYANSPAVSFRTTWIKVMSISEGALKKYTELGNVYEKFDSLGAASARRALKILNPTSLSASSPELNGIKDLAIVSSKWHSIDANQLDWCLTANPKVVTRLANLSEARGPLYSSEGTFTGWDSPHGSAGPELARRELVTNIAGFLSNRQQNTVSQQMFRYLHQSIGGLDCDYLGVMKKVEGIRLKSLPEISTFAKTTCVYTLAIIARTIYGVDAVRAENKEVFVVAPDLILASRDPHMNVSTYAMSSQFNADKENRAASEAICTEAVWAQTATYRQCMADRRAATVGMTSRDIALFRRLRRRGQLATLADLTARLNSGSFEVAKTIENVALLGPGGKFTKSLWFTLMIGLQTRTSIGTYASISTLSGQSVSDLFTTRGSFTATDFVSCPIVESTRKATAAATVLAWRNLGEDVAQPVKSLALAEPKVGRTTVDRWDLIMSYLAGHMKTHFYCQLSEKDAEGKDREISTQQISFAITTISVENLCMPLSESIPEDVVTEKNKDLKFSRMIEATVEAKGRNPDLKSAFVSGDMSLYGPNMMCETLLMGAAALCPDMTTYNLFEHAVVGSREKEVRPPHNLIAQSLKPSKVVNNGETSYTMGVSAEEIPCYGRGRTANVMAKLHEQYHKGNENGPKGSLATKVETGMPGQGVFTVFTSINHAGTVRFLLRYLKRRYSWIAWGLVTGDDSLSAITFPSADEQLVSRLVRPVRAFILSLIGLIDNPSKFNIVWLRPEINSFYFLGVEAIHPVWRYSGAMVSLETTANIQEDLLASSARSAEVCAKGGSHETAAVVAAVSMSTVIDAHHMWPTYYESLRRWSLDGDYDDCLLFAAPEYFGLPAIDPAAALVTPNGTRAASMVSGFPDGSADVAYSSWAAARAFEAPSFLRGGVMTDTQGVSSLVGDTLTALYDNHNGIKGTVIVLPEVQLPYVNGLLGKTRRARATFRLSRELGKDLLLWTTSCRLRSSNLSVTNTVLTALRSLSRPITSGDHSLAAHVQYADLEHSHNFPHYSKDPACLLPGHDGMFSRRDLYETLSRKGVCKSMREAFLNKVATSIPIPDWAEPLHKIIRDEMGFALNVTRDASVSVPERDISIGGGPEHLKALLGARRSIKRVVNIGPAEGVQVDWDMLGRRILSSLLSPSEYVSLPVSLMGGLTEDMCVGGFGIMRAVPLAEALLNRIKAAIPASRQILTYVDVHSRTRGEFLQDFLTKNARSGVRLRIPGEHVASRIKVSLSSSTAAPYVKPDVAKILSACVLATVESSFNPSAVAPASKLQSTTYRPTGVENFSVGGGLTTVSNVHALMRDSLLGVACANAQASLSTSVESWESVLLCAARIGWSGTPSLKSKSNGLVATWKTKEGEVAKVYSITTRTVAMGANKYTTNFIHTHPYVPSFQLLSAVPSADSGSLGLLREYAGVRAQSTEFVKQTRKGPRLVSQDFILFTLLHAGLDATLLLNGGVVVARLKKFHSETLIPIRRIQLGLYEPPACKMPPRPTPAASDIFKDLTTFRNLAARPPELVDHLLVGPASERGCSHLFEVSGPDKATEIRAWAETVLLSLGSKCPLLGLREPTNEEEELVAALTKQDSEDSDTFMEAKIEMDMGRSGIEREEWRLATERSLQALIPQNVTSSDLNLLVCRVLNMGYQPTNHLLYLASLMYSFAVGSADPGEGVAPSLLEDQDLTWAEGKGQSFWGPGIRDREILEDSSSLAVRRRRGGLLPEMDLMQLAGQLLPLSAPEAADDPPVNQATVDAAFEAAMAALAALDLAGPGPVGPDEEEVA